MKKGIGSSDLKRTHYWRMDYVRMQILKTILAVFVAFVLAIFYRFYTHGLRYAACLGASYRTILIYGGIVFAAAEILFVILLPELPGVRMMNRVQE